MSCTHTDDCELYTQFAMNPALQVWKQHYCQGDFKRCVRFQMALRKETVPLNLLPNGTKVEAPRSANDYNASIVFNAILKSRMSLLESLLRNGADINISNSDGMTPLMAAANNGNMDIIRMLLARGADAHATNGLGETSADIAARMGHGEAAKLLKTAKAGSARSRTMATAAKQADAPKGLFGFLRRT